MMPFGNLCAFCAAQSTISLDLYPNDGLTNSPTPLPSPHFPQKSAPLIGQMSSASCCPEPGQYTIEGHKGSSDYEISGEKRVMKKSAQGGLGGGTAACRFIFLLVAISALLLTASGGLWSYSWGDREVGSTFLCTCANICTGKGERKGGRGGEAGRTRWLEGRSEQAKEVLYTL